MHRKEPQVNKDGRFVALILILAAVAAIVVAGSMRDTVTVVITPYPVIVITTEVGIPVTVTPTPPDTPDSYEETWFAADYATGTARNAASPPAFNP